MLLDKSNRDSYKTMVYTSVNWTLKKTFDDYTLDVTPVTREYYKKK